MRTTKILTGLTALALLVACVPPPAPVGRGPAFDTPAQAAERREAQLSGAAPLQPDGTFVSPPPGTLVVGETSAGFSTTEAQDIANRTRAALGRPAAQADTGFGTPPPVAPPPALDRDNPTISQREQDFAAVSAERGIQADAQRLEAARQQYQQVAPTELQRPDSTGPNIFAYALGPAKPVGTQGAFRRGRAGSASRTEAKCLEYRGPDNAQEAFLAAGGPERDRLGIDPDGDGNACGWDPSVTRRLVQN